jgi:hypothetical protein
LWAFLFRRDSMTSFSFSFPFKKMSNRCNDVRVIKTPKRAASNCVSILYMCVCDTTRHIR